MNSSTGAITGTPAAEGTRTATVTLTDARSRTASVTFDWQIAPPLPLQITSPGAQTVTNGQTITAFALQASGGVGPYTWQATNLPTGLTVSTAGSVSGTVTSAGRYVSTIRATDSEARTASINVVWTVTPRPYVDLGVTIPSPPDRSTRVGTPVWWAPSASGGIGGYYWTGTNLPPGLSISPDGVVSGWPTTPGTSIVKLRVIDSYGRAAHLMFTWTATP